nr:MAG TPA: hypothetical protein [Caudoviricetes sp.]
MGGFSFALFPPSMPPHSPGTAPAMIGEYPDKASPKDGAQSRTEGA